MRILERAGTQWPALVLAIFILASGAINSFSGAFIYNKVNLTAKVSKPPLIIWKPQHGQLTYKLGPNQTSITTNISLEPQAQLLNNPEFHENPDAWTCAKNNTLLSCRFLSSDTGAIGGVRQVFGQGNFASFTAYWAGPFQIFMSPDNNTRVYASVRYSAPSIPNSILDYNYIIIAIFKWNGSAWNQIGQTYTRISQTRTYTYYNATITLSEPIAPLNFYAILVAYYYYSFVGGTQIIDVRFDSIRLNLTPTNSTLVFGGEALRINTTVAETVFIDITNISSTDGINADIYVENDTTIALIATVRDGRLVFTRNLPLLVRPSGDSYNASARLIVEANATRTGVNMTIRGHIYYTNDVYHVIYPFTLRISG